MLKQLKNRKQEGFTIIEVLIVLAIAALILLIVFLAVPALQRNSRNTQRKNDVGALLAGVNDYVTNNNGSTPDKCSGTSTVIFDLATGGVTTSEAKAAYFNKGCAPAATTASGTIGLLAVPVGGVAVPATAASASLDYVNIFIGGACDDTTAGKVNVGSSRSIAAQYQIENGAGKYAERCQSL